MSIKTEIGTTGGVALGAALSVVIPKDWPLWQEVAVVAVVCVVIYVAMKILGKSSNAEAGSE